MAKNGSADGLATAAKKHYPIYRVRAMTTQKVNLIVTTPVKTLKDWHRTVGTSYRSLRNNLSQEH